MIEDYIALPEIGYEELDQLTLQFGFSDWMILISPADHIEYQQDPEVYNITSMPLKGEVSR